MLIEARKTTTGASGHSLMQWVALLNALAQKCDGLAQRTRSRFLQRGERISDRDTGLQHRPQLVIKNCQVFGGRSHSYFAAVSNGHDTLLRKRGKLNRETGYTILQRCHPIRLSSTTTPRTLGLSTRCGHLQRPEIH